MEFPIMYNIISRFSRLAFCCMAVTAFSIPTIALGADDLASTGTRTHEQAIETSAGKFIQTLGDKAIAVIANKDFSQEQKAKNFAELLDEYFDLKTISRFVIGRSWNSATEAQQQEYISLFEKLIIKNYGSKMSMYTGEGFKVTGTRPESASDTVVLSQIAHPGTNRGTNIDWRVRDKDGKIGVIDVVMEGVSMSVTQKQEYASIIQGNGGDIEGLLKLMRQQAAIPDIVSKEQ